MNIKQKIWSLPIVAVLIFTIGIAVTYALSSSTLTLLSRIGKIDYPFLDKTQLLIADLKGIQETLKNAVNAGDKEGLDLAAEKAVNFRKTVEGMSEIPGKTEIAGKIMGEFDAYYQSASESAAIMLGIKPATSVSPWKRCCPPCKHWTPRSPLPRNWQPRSLKRV